MGDKVIEVGDRVVFRSTVTLEDGTVIHTSDKPVSVEIGKSRIIRGLYKELLGMREGEEKQFRVPPEEAYGPEDANLFKSIPLEIFEKNKIEPKIGMRIRTINGDCEVTGVFGQVVEVNYNHPLAGKTLIFNVRIEEITKGEASV